jgi:hypothetical protein
MGIQFCSPITFLTGSYTINFRLYLFLEHDQLQSKKPPLQFISIPVLLNKLNKSFIIIKNLKKNELNTEK